MFTVRRYRTTDFESVLALMTPAYSPGGDLGYEWPRAEIRRYAEIYANAKDVCFVAEDETGVIGTALAYVLEDDPGVLHLEVLEPSTGEVARVLTNAILKVAKNRRKMGLRKLDSPTVKVEFFAPVGHRSEAMSDMGFSLSQHWVYCRNTIS